MTGTAGTLAAVELRHADDADTLFACFPVIRQLRPALMNVDDWLDRAWAMTREGYRILAAWRAGGVVGVAGYRVMVNLIHGRFLYVDDLVTDADARAQGIGAALLRKLIAIAREQGCARLVLDTAATNEAARRFYRREGLLEAVVGFVLPLGSLR